MALLTRELVVPILPFIDALILMAWTTLAIGGVLKVVNTTFGVHWQLLGFAPSDLLVVGLTLLVFSLALIGRTWVKQNDPGVVAERRKSSTLEAYARMTQNGDERGENGEPRASTAQVQSS